VEHQKQKQFRLLVVDDEKPMTELIAYALTKMSYRFRTANSASGALDLLRESPADILITDIHMPEMSGLELTKEVLRLYPDTVVIAVTGGGDISLAVEFMKIGGIDFLQKPVNIATLKLSIESAADRWQLRQDLKQADEKLRQKNECLQKEVQARIESEDRNKKLFETHSAVMLIVDPETGDIVNANQAACAYYGYTKDEIACLKITDINMLPKEEVFREMQRAASQEKNFFSFRHRLSDGEIRDVEVFSVPTKEKSKNLLYSTIRDVSWRIRAEKALQESEQRYREVFENAPFGVYQASFEGSFIKVNPAMARMFGHDSPEKMVSGVEDIKTLYLRPEQRQEIIQQALEHQGWFIIETDLFRKDKSILIVKTTLRTVRNETGEPLYLEGFVEDITEKRKQKERFLMEMSRAKDIYNLILEPQLPMMPDVGIYVKCFPADKVGGDVLELLEVGEKKLLLFLADVTGHGIPAAMTANTLKMLFREIAKKETSPAAICEYLNRVMSGIILPDDIIAVFCGLADLKSMTLTYYLSGLPFPLILRNQSPLFLKPTGLPLGIFDSLDVNSQETALKKGDIFIAFTDGVTEVKSSEGRLFGSKGVKKSITEKTAPDANTAVDNIIKESLRFHHKEKFQDDVIVLAASFLDENEAHSVKGWNRFCSPDKCLFKMKTKDIDIDEAANFIVSHLAEKSGLSSRKLGMLRIAFFELLTNAVEHGNLELTPFKKDPEIFDSGKYRSLFEARINSHEYGERTVRVECFYKAHQLEISIEDDGSGFNISEVPNPAHKDHFSKASGRGIVIARMNADEIFYNARGNKVTLRIEN
jgi:PAS domain S-box-containing protein